MAVPKHIFIDTSVLDGCSFNFEATALKPIVDAASETSITLLLPEPTEREMWRHIKGRSEEVFDALRKAQQRAPFLKKWNKWPLNNKHDFMLTFNLNSMASKELNEFFDLFTVVKLKSSDINVADVIQWYENGDAPFGKGKKKAEFPDAFALSSLLTFAKRENQTIAIISNDDDFKNASDLYDCLFYYPTVGKYVESLLLSEEHVRKVRKILNFNSEMISDGIREKFVSLGFYPVDDLGAELEDVEVEELEFSELSIIGTGQQEVSISFQAAVSFWVEVKLDETDWQGPAWREERVLGYTDINGIAKLTVNKDWSVFDSLNLLTIDEDDIGVETDLDTWDRR